MSQSLQTLLARAQVWNGSAWVNAPGDAANGLDVDVTRSALPTGASTETTLAGVKTGTDKIPASPAQEHATAASPHSARLSDGGSYIGSTAQRLHVDDGGSSLTVDGSVAADTELPAAAALSDTTANPTAPAVGAHALVWDNNSGLWKRAMSQTSVEGTSAGDRFPAVGGMMYDGASFRVMRGDAANGLDVDITRVQGTVDTGDRAAREVGRARIWDGTDEATVLPVRTQPATTEKGVVTSDLPVRIPTYACTTIEIAPAITVGVKELLALWHTGAKDIYIVEIWVCSLITTASTAGRSTIRVSTITSAPTGGTEEAKADIGGAGASDMANTMRAKTGGGAIGSTFIRKEWLFATQPLGRVSESIFLASNPGNGIILRGSANAGISIDEERAVAHTALAEQVTVGVRWLEL